MCGSTCSTPRRASARVHWIDLAGALLLLLPYSRWCCLLVRFPTPRDPAAILEHSHESCGLRWSMRSDVFPLCAVLMRCKASRKRSGRWQRVGALMPLAEFLAVLMVIAVIAVLMGWLSGGADAGRCCRSRSRFLVTAMGCHERCESSARLPQRIFGVMTNETLLAVSGCSSSWA